MAHIHAQTIQDRAKAKKAGASRVGSQQLRPSEQNKKKKKNHFQAISVVLSRQHSFYIFTAIIQPVVRGARSGYYEHPARGHCGISVVGLPKTKFHAVIKKCVNILALYMVSFARRKRKIKKKK